MLFFGHLGITLALVFLVFWILKDDSVDYRLIFIGSLLPDIIDKPIGQYIFYNVFYSGRIFAHTMLFLIVLIVISVLLEKYKKNYGFSFLTLGTAFHILQDELWYSPETLFWPLLGWEFPKYVIDNYLLYLLQNLLSNLDIFLSEIIGLLILAVFVYNFKLYRRAELKSFLFSGKIFVSKKIVVSILEN
jgi:membrane-bound metal-dependent hydrolase YbcI (DUF457 family)